MTPVIRSASITAVALALAAALPGLLPAQAVDRSQPPALDPPPTLRLPAVQSADLPNGLRLRVVETREVPVVQFLLAVDGGGREDGSRPGLASFTANMLDEGADTLDAFGIAALAEYLGASLGTGADWDLIQVSLKVPTRTMGPALDLMAAVALKPRLLAAEVQRQRDLRLASILQQRDQPETIANLAFSAIVFPAAHPYHSSLGGDSASTAALDSATVRGFYDRVFCPDRAQMVVVGDIGLAEAKAAVAKRFGAWKACRPAAARRGRVSGEVTPAVPPAFGQSAVYLIDKPGAAQSVIRIGHPGVPRSTKDYYAIQVMNTILGGSFSSRLNSNLRETKGYTYGAGSGFSFRPLPGPFTALASVRTDATDSSLVEFFKELRAIREAPVEADELERAKAYLALGLAGDLETTSQIAREILDLGRFGLGLSFYDDYVQRVMAVTAQDVQRVAQEYVRPDRASVVVVGDLTRVRAGVEALGIGPSSLRDIHGRGVP